jgi:hypothetical protein
MPGDAFPQGGLDFPDGPQGLTASLGEVIQNLAPASAPGLGPAVGFRDVTLAGEFIQRDINRPQGTLISRGFLCLVSDGNTEGAAFEPPNGQEDDLLATGQEPH